MADSPAKRHLQRVEAEEAAMRAAGGNLMEGTPIYQQTLLQLATDRARLKQIQSGKAKGQLKAALLPTYDAYIEGVLAADAGGQDDVVSTLMLWNIDAGLYGPALDIAAYVLAHGLTMPDRFERTAGCVVAEEIGIAALNALKTGAAFDLGVLNRAVEVTKGHDMPDQVRARLLLARARCLLPPGSEETPPNAEDVGQAVEDLREAIRLHDSCGGKEDLKRAERLMKKFEASQSND